MNELINVTDAEQAIAAHMPMFGSELIALQLATGRVLRQPVVAEHDQPPFDRVTMDGIAIHWNETLPREFTSFGKQFAGMSGAVLSSDQDCIEVATGAALPGGCDCVIPIEYTERIDGRYRLRRGFAPERGQFIHRHGSDCAAGALVLQPGVRIGPAEAALLAGNGVAEVEVAKVPRIAIIITGDELVGPGEPLGAGQIRRSNDAALLAAFQSYGLGQVSSYHVRDDELPLREILKRALDENDVLILSGGVSMGQRDLVPAALQELGIQRVFHRIAQRPGKPMWFGVGQNRRVVFALPGNPVSSLVCAIRYARPALLRAMGWADAAIEYVTLATDVQRNPELTCFVAVELQSSASGGYSAIAAESRNSGNFTSLAGTQGVVELPPGQMVMPKGAVVRLYRWW